MYNMLSISSESFFVIFHQLVCRPELGLWGAVRGAWRGAVGGGRFCGCEGGVGVRVVGAAEGGVAAVVELAVGDVEVADELWLSARSSV